MEVFIMNQSKLTSLQFSCLIIFPILALFSGIGTHNIIKIAEIDSYITVLISYVLGLLPLFIFISIFNYKEDLTIIEKVNYLFGKYLGFIINLIINILYLFIGVILIYNISNFAISQFLSETPLLVFMLFFGVVLIYSVSKGIENISRVGIIFLGIIIFLTIISTTGAVIDFETSNIKPILEHGFNKPMIGGVALTLTNIVPIFMLLIVPKDKVEHNQKTKKHLIIFYTLGFIFMFLAILLTIGSLGIYLSDIYQYPEYTVLKKISLFEFSDRIENFIYIKWIFNSVICLSLIIYYVSSSMHKKSKNLLPTIVMIILVLGATFVFKNNTIFYEFGYNIFPYANLMLLSIFVIIGINIFIRKRLLNEE